MADSNKVLIKLKTGLEDGERATVALLVATAALSASKQVATWLTKEAERLALPGFPEAVARDGRPPLARLFEQVAQAGGDSPYVPDLLPTRASEPKAISLPTQAWLARRRSGSGSVHQHTTRR